MKRYRVCACLVAVLYLASCNPGEDYKDRFIDVSFEQVVQFGKTDSLTNSTLHAVSGVESADNGNIYVADAAESVIKVYSSNGDYLKSFGEKGRGPGEFNTIRNIELADSTIYVWDQPLQRLSVFNVDGKLLKTHSIKGVASTIKIIPFMDSFLLLYPEGRTDPSNIADVTLAHFYKADLSAKKSSFLKISDLNIGNKGISSFLFSITGSVLKKNNDSLMFVPSIYSGTFYRFKKQRGKWKKAEELKGIWSKTAFSQVEEDSDRKPDLSLSSIYYDDKLNYIIHSMSRGLFYYKNYYFHFTFSDFDKTRKFGVEIYNQKFEPLDYAPIKSIPITNKENNLIQWHVDDVDEEGNFYIRERYSGGSRIRVIQVSHEDLERLSPS
ncbi:6-bladed beta-propeller [Fodinibius halophilus]|uniref:6-bladed beta-propeller n=1 Tax=Fodinibius halophilus TaxID=1736908 RepID=A0A6M1TAB9_9BACT|nr:6-bladed beta-propeller [Fodinibius halophilus]NGP87292.1 6-bladed beta-propeller [Fodinibius halophilus]